MTEFAGEFQIAVQATPWDARTIPTGSPAASGQVYGRACVLTGVILRETGGTNPATVDVYNGSTGSGELIASIYVDKSETRVIYPMVGCPSGVYLDVVSGDVTGAVWVVDALAG